MGIGNLSIISIDRTLPRLELHGIPDPAVYKKYLASKVTVRASEVEMFRSDVDGMSMDDVDDFEEMIQIWASHLDFMSLFRLRKFGRSIEYKRCGVTGTHYVPVFLYLWRE